MKLNTLPPDLTNFVGRRREVMHVKDAIRTSRLVTLTGPGGVGKTRLGTEAARRLAGEFSGGVAFVELAEVTNPDHIALAIAETMRLRIESGISPLDALCGYLSTHRLLLLLDNCEHLAPACGRLVRLIMRRAPHVGVLATSREPLGILGELTWNVPPLKLPRDSAETLPEGDAVDLFLARARSAMSDFTPGADELHSIGRLCRHLDGMPLAIELAAVRIRSFSVDQILSQKMALFDVLKVGNRAGPARHQTLWAAIHWSYELSSPDERALWERLAVFSGSFDLQAVEQVCAGDGITASDVVSLLGDLVEKSVVTRTEGRAGGRRYRLLESIRMFGLELCGSVEVWRRRHRDYYLQLAEQSERSSLWDRQLETVQRLEGSLGNIRAALEYSFTHPAERLLGLRMTAALWFYWNACGHLQDGCHWLRRALVENPDPSADRAKALWVLGWFEMLRGNNAAARENLDECRSVADEIEDETASICAIQFRGTVEQIDGDFAHALDLLEAARKGHERSGQPSALSILCGAQLAFVHCLTGEVDKARQACDLALAQGALHAERWATSWVLWARGLTEHLRGDLASSASLLRDSIDLKRSLGDWLGVTMCVEILAWNAVDTGWSARAARLLGIGRMLHGSMGGMTPLFGASALVEKRDVCEARARLELGDEIFDAEYAAGHHLELPAALHFALEEPSGEPEPTEPEPTRPAPTADREEVLTARELQISRLIAAGLRNSDIAESLTISRRTVEGHVNRILAKLNFRSRAQVAAWMTRRQFDLQRTR
ncbi:LuxR C-terminal-related transcriptional regulator [Frankia sp. ACN1ag]|uniref:ATP-binding protein n=1 Tax=Frankia sp. ACN1ag TaxID=102891 RepID=UPI0006DC94E1|nr:LuxR C-terminal-related transcriptional regulator [Frankia sp. ACN1ag]